MRVTIAARSLGTLLATVLAAPVMAEEAGSAEDEDDGRIIVYGRAIEVIGIAQSGSQGTVGFSDFEDVPISRTGELVENVPGVIATQHSGSGKANQYFLRGFNLDHGTDFAGFVDGVPINMRTHGHGQGYLDFNFVIPETLERIDYRKGPYFADVGDFTAAGTVAFKTADTLDPFAEVEAGAFGFRRGVAGGSAKLGSGDLLIAAETQFYNGPWALDEDLERFAGLIKFSTQGDDNSFSVQLNAYDSRWNSTDQVPQRAIDSGLIDRFGNIDPDLGGKTTRLGAVINGTAGSTRYNAFATWYDFRLVSNFTYFLEDPVDGDQFVQIDRRWVLGGSVDHRFDLGSVDLTLGANLRHDAISRVGLFNSVDGVATTPIRTDSVDETGFGLFASGEVTLAPGLRAILGLRYDFIAYDVSADLSFNSGDGNDGILAPKASLAWRVTDAVEIYANYGQSFHSNDVRGATIAVDPLSGDPADRVPVFARAEGAEFGARVQHGDFHATLVGFWLELDSELVFVGDGGSTEPNDASRRYGIEASLFWHPVDWLLLEASYAKTDARFVGPPAGSRDIPGAVPDVIAGGVTIKPVADLTLTAQLRHFGSAPLIEDGSVMSESTSLVNLGGYWDVGPMTLGAEVFNLFDARDADITYFYESRLAGEAAGVEDLHIHPVEPRQLRLSARYRF